LAAVAAMGIIACTQNCIMNIAIRRAADRPDICGDL
jgi:hypothetical protein